jgi:hypothetical protein
MGNWLVRSNAENLEPVDDVMKELLARNGRRRRSSRPGYLMISQ